MQLKSIKTQKEFIEACLNPNFSEDNYAELIVKDKTIVGARIGTVHFGIEGYNTLTITTEVPYTEDERYRVEAKLIGFPSSIVFHKESYEADSAVRLYENISGASVKKEKVKAFIDNNDNIISYESLEVPKIITNNDEDVPF